MSISPYDPNNSLWEGYDRMPAAPQTRQTATFQANGFSERVTVPLIKAAIVGPAVGILTGLLIGAFHITWLNPWWTIPIITLSVFLSVFLATSNRGQWLIERLTGADLNHDGFIGQPAQTLPPALPERITLEVVQENGHRGDILTLPCGQEKLKALASGLVQGRQFAQSAWTGNGALFTRAEFEEARTELIRAGLIRWNKPGFPAQGVSVTPAGKSIFRRLAEDQSPTTRE